MNDHKIHFYLEKGLFSSNSSPGPRGRLALVPRAPSSHTSYAHLAKPASGGTARPTRRATTGDLGRTERGGVGEASPQPRPRDSLPRNHRENNCLRKGGGDSRVEKALGRAAGESAGPEQASPLRLRCPHGQATPRPEPAIQGGPPLPATPPSGGLARAELWKPQAPPQGAVRMPSGRRTQFHLPEGTWRGLAICRRQRAGHPDPRAGTYLSYGTSSGRTLPLEGPRRVTCSRFHLSLRGRHDSFGLRFPQASGAPRRSDSISQASRPRSWPGAPGAGAGTGPPTQSGRGSPATRDWHRAQVTLQSPWTFPNPRLIPNP